ncbi:MAG: JmjC domain-containing protein, partial [Rhodospirillales bacterium]
MSTLLQSFEALLAPMTPEEFFSDYFNKKPVLICGDADKFDTVINWRSLSELLNMTELWSAENLNMVLDTEMIPTEAFCKPATDRRLHPVMQPDARKVKALLNKGASLALNSIDSFTPGLRSVATTIESAVRGKAQVNLYCSRKQRKAFKAHGDSHDVFALHCEGEKEWWVYEGRQDRPINHPLWKYEKDGQGEREKGKVLMHFVMTPGDMLYLPRGQYHDALSVTDACAHVALGVTYSIGLELLDLVWEHAVRDAEFRTNLPSDPSEMGEKDLALHLASLGKRLDRIVSSPAFLKQVRAYQASFHYDRGGYDLPGDFAAAQPKAPAA